MSFSVN